MHVRRTDACLALQQLRDGFKRDPVEPERISPIRYSKRGKDSSAGCVLLS